MAMGTGLSLIVPIRARLLEGLRPMRSNGPTATDHGRPDGQTGLYFLSLLSSPCYGAIDLLVKWFLTDYFFCNKKVC